jgi:hypothetical protein
MCCIISVLFSSKCRLFHNSTSFGSCIIHILNTGCAKILKKFRRQRVNNLYIIFWKARIAHSVLRLEYGLKAEEF